MSSQKSKNSPVDQFNLDFCEDTDQSSNLPLQNTANKDQLNDKVLDNQNSDRLNSNGQCSANESKDISEDVNQRSICVRNVEYSSTPEEIKDHFKDCCGDKGASGILRVTILKHKINGHPLGQCYIEFENVNFQKNSKELDESLFKGRQITVLDKRQNIPRHGSKSFRGRGSNPNVSRGRGSSRGFFNPMMRGMLPGRGIRGRGVGRGQAINYGQPNPMLMAAMMMAAQGQFTQQTNYRGRGRGSYRGSYSKQKFKKDEQNKKDDQNNQDKND